VRRVAAQQTANAEDRIILVRFGERAGGQRNLECAGNADQRDVLLLSAGA